MSLKSLIPQGDGNQKKAWLLRAILASVLLICAAQLPDFFVDQNYYLHLRGAWLFGSSIGGPEGHHAILLGMVLQLMIEAIVFNIFKNRMPNNNFFYRTVRLTLLVLQVVTMLVWLTWIPGLLYDPSVLPPEERLHF